MVCELCVTGTCARAHAACNMHQRTHHNHHLLFFLCLVPACTGGPRSILPQLQLGQKLLHVVEEWLRQERDGRRERQATQTANALAVEQPASVVPSRTPIMPNKHLAFFR